MIRADKDLAFLLQYENVAWYQKNLVRILDRRIYPKQIKYIECTNHKEVAKAIHDMVTQSGGPYIAAAMGMALAANEANRQSKVDFMQYMKDAAYILSHARPTTVERMSNLVTNSLEVAEKALAEGKKVDQVLFEDTLDGLNKKYLRIEKMAEFLVEKFPTEGIIMTQCFGEVIVGMMGKQCRNMNKQVKFICPETRPYLQGARLTASVLCDMGFDVTVITDNMPGYILKEKKVDVFTSAADVITMDGHIINKIGTFQIALAANYWNVPYFVTGAPIPEYPNVESVKIEERDPEDVLRAMGVRTVMEGIKGYYPAFDITPPNLCDGVVTYKGMFSAFDLNSFFKQEK